MNKGGQGCLLKCSTWICSNSLDWLFPRGFWACHEPTTEVRMLSSALATSDPSIWYVCLPQASDKPGHPSQDSKIPLRLFSWISPKLSRFYRPLGQEEVERWVEAGKGWVKREEPNSVESYHSPASACAWILSATGLLPGHFCVLSLWRFLKDFGFSGRFNSLLKGFLKISNLNCPSCLWFHWATVMVKEPGSLL